LPKIKSNQAIKIKLNVG